MSREDRLQQGVGNGAAGAAANYAASTAGRRPFIINPQSRNMLNMIKDTLGSKVPVKNGSGDDTDYDNGSLSSSSSLGLVQQPASGSINSSSISSNTSGISQKNRIEYNKNVMKKIAQGLKPFQTTNQGSASENHNNVGNSTSASSQGSEDGETMKQKLLSQDELLAQVNLQQVILIKVWNH